MGRRVLLAGFEVLSQGEQFPIGEYLMALRILSCRFVERQTVEIEDVGMRCFLNNGTP